MEIPIRSYKTIAAAKRNGYHQSHSPAIVRHEDGRYLSYPAGQPIPRGAVIIERQLCGVWRRIKATA
jgi:hypothetical protein